MTKEFSRDFYKGFGIYNGSNASSLLSIGNVGAGNGVYKGLTGTQADLKTLIATSPLAITNNTNDLTFTTTAEANTASNLGTGTGVFQAKVGADLQFVSLAGSNGVSISKTTTDMTVSGFGCRPNLTEWLYNTSTSDANPGSGKFSFNNATIASATFIYINLTDNYGANIASTLLNLQAGAQLFLKGVFASTTWQTFTVTGAVTNASTYYKIPVSYLSSGAGSPFNNQTFSWYILGATPSSLINAGGVSKLETTNLGIIDNEHTISTDMHGCVVTTGAQPFTLNTLSLFGRQAVAASCTFDIGIYNWSSGATVTQQAHGNITYNLAANTIAGGSVTLGTPLVLSANSTYWAVVTGSNANFALYSKSGGLASANEITFLKAGVGATLPGTITLADRGNSGRAIYMKLT